MSNDQFYFSIPCHIGTDSNITYGEDTTITCSVDGGKEPYQVDLITANNGKPSVFYCLNNQITEKSNYIESV